MPLLEELVEAPVLRTEELSAEQQAELKGFTPPLLLSQVEASLTHEFGQPILETDWSQYEDPTTSYEQAARLLHHTLAIYSNVARQEGESGNEWVKKLADSNNEWVRKECELLMEEIQSGDYSRWELVDELAGPAISSLTAKQQQVVRPAIAIISKNAWLHPRSKTQVVDELCRVVSNTVKE